MTKNKFKKVYIKNVLVNKIFVSILTSTFVISSTSVHGLNTDIDSSILSNNELNLESIDNKSIEDIAQEDKILDEPKLQAIKSFAEPTEVIPQDPELNSEAKDKTLDSNSDNINKDQTNLLTSYKKSQKDSTNQILSKSKKHVTGKNNKKINLTKYKYLLNAIDTKTPLVVLGVPTLIGGVIAIGKKVTSKFVNKSSKNLETQQSTVSPITPMPGNKSVSIPITQKVPKNQDTYPQTITNEVLKEIHRLTKEIAQEKNGTKAERIKNEQTFLICMLGLYQLDIGVHFSPDMDLDNFLKWKNKVEEAVKEILLTIQKLTTDIATYNSINKHLQNRTNWWATGKSIEQLDYHVPLVNNNNGITPYGTRRWVKLKPGSLLFCLYGLCLCCGQSPWHSTAQAGNYCRLSCPIHPSTCDLYYWWNRMMKTYSWTKY